MRTRYILYIYAPDEVSVPAYRVESDGPFLTFQRGDLINPRTWPPNSSAPFTKSDANPHGLVLRVTGVEHLLYETPGGLEGSLNQHTIRVYTAAAADVEGSRIESRDTTEVWTFDEDAI
jgi:hypothetical protein